MAEMVGKTGKVVGIEHIPELVEQSKQNIKRGNADLLESGQVVLVTGDGRQGYENGKWKGNRKSQNLDMLEWQNRSRDGAVVSALTFHQCGQERVCCWFSPLLREVYLQVLQFSFQFH